LVRDHRRYHHKDLRKSRVILPRRTSLNRGFLPLVSGTVYRQT
jgi:hypothetical protein